MPRDLLKAGAAWLARTRTEHMASRVTYARGGSSVSVRATVGQSSRQVDDAHGGFLDLVTRDYLIRRCDLRLDGALVEPAAGDRILDPCTERTYEVMPVPGEGPWRYADGYGLEYRVHTKLVDAP